MKLKPFKAYLIFILFIIPALLFPYSPSLRVNKAIGMISGIQEKGGVIAPKPKPIPKKITPPKKSVAPVRTGRRSSTRTNSGNSRDGNAAAVEIALWNSIKDSTNTEDYRAYLKKYPDGQFADIAQNRINSLEMAKRKDEMPSSTTSAPSATRRSRVPRAGAIVRNQMGMEFAYVPAGSFTMGSPPSEVGRRDDEGPQHRVTIREGFYMGKYEVTQAQYQALMGMNPSHFKGDNLPVEQVSLRDTEEFIRRMNARNDGFTYRLPSEAEWEYACRAGTTGDYAGSLDAMAWYYENSGNALLSGEWDYDKLKANDDRTHPVGQKQTNAWGLYDMHGNVWEWCEDLWHDNYNGAPSDGSAWMLGDSNERVLRGGSFISTANALRSARRYWFPPDARYHANDLIGFRVIAVA